MRYSATDYAGNRTQGTISARVDNVPPRTLSTLSAGPDGAPRIALSVTEKGSGLDATTYRIDDGPALTHTGPFTLDPDRPHLVRFASTDVVGLKETEQGIFVRRAGDVDGNGEVGILDAVYLLRVIAEGDPHPWKDDPKIFTPADLNGNGALEVGDAVRLLKKLVGL